MTKQAVRYSFNTNHALLMKLGEVGVEALGDPRSKLMNPDWVLAPGATLAERVHDRAIPLERQLEVLGLTEPELERLLDGDMEITVDLAKRLHELTFIAVRVWLRMEQDYRAGLAAGKRRV